MLALNGWRHRLNCDWETCGDWMTPVFATGIPLTRLPHETNRSRLGLIYQSGCPLYSVFLGNQGSCGKRLSRVNGFPERRIASRGYHLGNSITLDADLPVLLNPRELRL